MTTLTTIVNDSVAFRLQGGTVLRSIQDLIDALQGMSSEQFQHHVRDSRNDFANWIEDIFHHKFLAQTLRSLRTKQQMIIALEVALHPTKKIVNERLEKAIDESIIVHNKTAVAQPEKAEQNLHLEEIHKQIQHLESELSHLLKYEKHNTAKVVHAVTDDIKSRLIDFTFGLLVGLIAGLMIARSIGIL